MVRTNEKSRSESWEGTVEDVSFRSPDGRFTVAKLSIESISSKPLDVTAVGDLGSVQPGETLRVHGHWEEHKTYGKRFRVESFTPITPQTKAGLVRYLGSGLVPGIGPKLAERLVDRFGLQTLDVLASQEERVRKVPGIGKNKATAIAEAVRTRRSEAESISFLHSVGLGPALARKVLQKYGDTTGRVLHEDPYLVAEQVAGIGFRTADAIGKSMGIAADDPRRAAGAALHLLGRAADDGHVFLEREALLRSGQALDVPLAVMSAAALALTERGLITADGDALYPPPLFAAEVRVAAKIAELSRPRLGDKRSEERIRDIDAALSDEQAEVVRQSVQHGVLVLTGGPGTGKTTTVKAIVEANLKLGRRVALCAPTGRAAKRLAEATGREARTIHRLLEWNPATGRFMRNEAEPIDAEVVLVDESSMLNMQLADSLFQSVAPNARLILVGDVDQLPPVGAGQVLREVMASECVVTKRLTQVFRQAAKSAIVRGAHAILRGEAPIPSEPGGDEDGVLYLIEASSPEKVQATLRKALERLGIRYGFELRSDVMVLTPLRRGPLGTEGLNGVLQRALNAEADPQRPGAFFPGDKVMQLANDYDRDVYNGDLGIVRRIEGGTLYIHFDGREVQYRIDDLDALTLAYASTVHKVQGSEFPAVVIVLHTSHHVMLSRSLLYTALTRAKRAAVIIGEKRAIVRAAQNAQAYDSNSRLATRIRLATAARDTVR